jgi:glycosyltransferase involved in cell wall biosynthesis
VAPIISVITICKGRLGHLKTTLPHLMALPDCEVIVVDYDCPDHAGDWVRATHPDARVVQVGDRPLFNVSRARNLGVAAASAPWLFMVDADVVVSPGLVDAVRAMLQPGAYLLPHPWSAPLSGAIIVARADFDAIGGYDEAFEGWGSEDLDLTARLDRIDRARATFPGDLLTSVPHDDALRVRFHEITDLPLNLAINAFYRAAKMDLLRQGVRLDTETARDLYAGVRAAVQAPGGPSRVNVVLPHREIAGRTLQATLSYQMSAAGVPPETKG